MKICNLFISAGCLISRTFFLSYAKCVRHRDEMWWSLYWRFVISKDADRLRLSHHQGRLMKWNGTKWMRWAWTKGGLNFEERENGRNPKKNLPILRSVHHIGLIHLEWSRRELHTPEVEGEELTICAIEHPFLMIIQSHPNTMRAYSLLLLAALACLLAGYRAVILTLLLNTHSVISFIFRVDGHPHRRIFAKLLLMWLLLDVSAVIVVIVIIAICDMPR